MTWTQKRRHLETLDNKYRLARHDEDWWRLLRHAKDSRSVREAAHEVASVVMSILMSTFMFTENW